MEGTNRDIPFEHQMLFIIRSYDNLRAKLTKVEEERDSWRDKYISLCNRTCNDRRIYEVQCRQLKSDLASLKKARKMLDSKIALLKKQQRLLVESCSICNDILEEKKREIDIYDKLTDGMGKIYEKLLYKR